jgi:hypothetical protein
MHCMVYTLRLPPTHSGLPQGSDGNTDHLLRVPYRPGWLIHSTTMTLDALNRKTTAERDGARRSGEYTNVDHASLLRSASCMLETHRCLSVKRSRFYISRTGETSSRPTVTLARSPIKRQAKTVNALGRFSGERDLWLAGHPSPDPVAGTWYGEVGRRCKELQCMRSPIHESVGWCMATSRDFTDRAVRICRLLSHGRPEKRPFEELQAAVSKQHIAKYCMTSLSMARSPHNHQAKLTG